MMRVRSGSGLCALVVFIALSLPAAGFAGDAKRAASAPADKAAVVDLKDDALGRNTPYGTVLGFLRAVDHGDYRLALSYLDGKEPSKEKEQQARDLETVLNRGLKIPLSDLSRAPEGRLEDGLSPYLEKVGTATYADEKLDIVLRRTTLPDTPPVWLFSTETLRGVRIAAEHLELPWAEAIWPESTRHIRIFSLPLFRLFNGLVVLGVLLAVTWLLTVFLVGRMHSVARRYGVDHDNMVLGSKWLIAALIYSIGMRLVAMVSPTMVGRIFFDYCGRVLMIVAVSWLLVRITRFIARIKTYRLRAGNLPGKIAAVELFGWLIAFMWVVIGLFLILSSLGVELTAAIAGLGVGSIAIAFAAQKTLENLFGTVMVVGDEVVKVGDYCQAGAIEGRIESIGLRSTRIRTLDRALVSVPNGQLAAMSVGSLAQRDKFLFRHVIRLRYDTTGEQLRQVIAKVDAMMSAQSDLEPTSARVRLVRLADAWLEVEAFAYVLTADGDVFVRRQHELLLQIIDIVEATGTALSAPAASVPVAATFSLSAPTAERPRAAR